MQKSRKNPWLLPGIILAVGLLGIAVFSFVFWHRSPPPRDYLTNSIGMKLVRIEPGKFLMGSPDSEAERDDDEGPQHEVEITHPFYMGTCEVTQEEYLKVMGTNPSVFTKNPRAAVENVSWQEAEAFCRQLSSLPEERAAGRVYRLPTEAEWEYACRAGTSTPYWFGDGSSIKTHCWYADNTHDREKEAAIRNESLDPPSVGEKDDNAFGLFDVHGNVREWCSDWYDKDYYQNSPSRDPQGPRQGLFRVARGGSRGDVAAACRSAARLGLAPHIRLGNGFRVVLEVGGGQK